MQGFPGGWEGTDSSCRAGDLGSFSEREDPLDKGMATHASILAWRIPWTEQPGRLWGHKESDMTEQLTLSHLSKFSDHVTV